MNYSSEDEEEDPFNKKYIKLQKIAEGTYGIVWKARNTQNNTIVAMKVFKNIGNEGLPVSAVRQVHMLKKIKSPYILQPLQLHVKPKAVSMVTQWKQLCLSKLLKQTIPIKPLMRHILQALDSIHRNFMLHRDLKPANIVLDSLLPDAMNLKIIDFGMAKQIRWNKNIEMTNEVGTLYYRAPELLQGENRYGYEIDIWAVGCIFYEMLTGQVLFKGENQALQLIKIYEDIATDEQSEQLIEAHKEQIQSIQLNHWKNISQSLIGRPEKLVELDLLKKLIKINPKQRIMCKEALNHSYFKQ